MWLRLRQIALVAHDIKVIEDFDAVFGLAVGHIDPGVGRWGLINRILPIGSQFLEIVAPVEENTPGGRYLDARGGDGGYMVITQCDDHDPRQARVAELNIRKVLDSKRDEFCNMQLHPKDTGGSFLEIDWTPDGENPEGSWAPAGTDWHGAVRTDVIDAITAAEVQGPDPDALATRWSEIVEIPVTQDGSGNPSLELQNATVRFVKPTDGRPEGLGGVDVRATDKARALSAAGARGLPVDGDTILISGTRFRLV